MSPVLLCLSASLALLSSATRATAAVGLSNDEIHRRKRRAMHAAMAASYPPEPDDISFSLAYSSARERRSLYYFHAGVEAAAINAARMAGVLKDEEEEEEEEGAYRRYLEGWLEGELADVRERLRAAEAEDEEEEEEEEEGDDGKVSSERTTTDSNADAPSKEKYTHDEKEQEPEERLYFVYTGAKVLFECDERPYGSLADVDEKWTEIRRRFWEFADAGDPPPERTDDDDQGEERRSGLFAAQWVEKGELVRLSRTRNVAYFQDADDWVDFLFSLPDKDHACLAIQSSSRTRVAAPGRWMVVVFLDAGAFAREEGYGDVKYGKGNVDFDFGYKALKDIDAGEEIIERAVS